MSLLSQDSPFDPPHWVAERKALVDSIEELHQQDRLKTREINTLVPENRALIAENERLKTSIAQYHKDNRALMDDLVELRKRENKLAAACHLVLLFYQAGWTDDSRQLWNLTMESIRKTGHDTIHGVTTKNLCDAVRAALNTDAENDGNKQQ